MFCFLKSKPKKYFLLQNIPELVLTFIGAEPVVLLLQE